ncbi:MAG: hypothetical protein ACOVOQ_07520 [Flavobacterium sp.]
MAATQAPKNLIGEAMKSKFGKPKPILTQQVYDGILLIPKKTFRKYVDNELQPRIDELTRIAQWLNVNPKDLF